MPRRGDEGDDRFLKTLQLAGIWLSAVQVAKAHRMSWYSVAFALRRLAERGLVEEDVVLVDGAARSKENSRVYRIRPQNGHNRRVTDLPAWMAPQAVVDIGYATMIEGSAGMRRWNDGDRRTELSGHPLRRASDRAYAGPERRGKGRLDPGLAFRCASALWARLSRPVRARR